MARTNKYSSINFNDIYEKKLKPSPSSSSSSTASQSPSSSSASLHNARTHHQGRMLVLTRPAPKPISIPQPPPQHHLPSPPPTPPQPLQSQSPPSSIVPDQARSEPDSISLRPLGRSGSGPASSYPPSPVLNQDRDKEVSVGLLSPKTDRFVPPHLRPGFVGREERFGSDGQKQAGFRPREFGNRQGHYGSPGRTGEDGRPRSGGGNERMRRGGAEPDLVEMSRPSSGGDRPNSRGWWVPIESLTTPAYISIRVFPSKERL